MTSHARTKQLFYLVSTLVMCTHFTLVYLFIRESFTIDAEEVPRTWYIPDQHSPLENSNGPHWGEDIPFSFEHNLTHMLRVLKSHKVAPQNSSVVMDDLYPNKLKQKRTMTQYRNLYDNYAGYEYENVECHDLVEPDDEFDEPLKWQEVVPRKVFVFSAYLEPGVKTDGGGKIVVIGMGESNWLMEERYYCQIWYRLGKAKVVKAVLERVEEHHDLKVVVNFWYCEVDATKDPYVVYMVHKTPCTDQPLNTLLIKNIDESQSRTRPFSNFTICISPLVNNYNNTNLLVENAELNQILGASLLVYYDHSSTENIKRYLDSYKNEDLATVIPWNLPLKSSNSYGLQVHYFAQLAALNDCFYRYKYSSKYIIFMDLDEFLIPRKQQKWSHLFEKIHNKSSASVFSFSHILFPLNSPDDELFKKGSLPKSLHLITQLKTKKDPVLWPRGIRSKYAVVPKHIEIVGVHSPLVVKNGFIKYVHSNDAVLHHYRKWDMGNTTDDLIEDRTLHLYQKALIKKIVRRHKIVKGSIL